MIYLDNNATTRMYPEALSAMLPWLEDHYANPSSLHRFGQESRQAVEKARYQLAALLGCKINELIFTSGGTEADNAAILGVLGARTGMKTIITSAVEHSAIREPVAALVKAGYRLLEIPVDESGHLDLPALNKHLSDPDVALLSLMWANNETGVIFDVAAVGDLAAHHGIPFHVDAVQAVGKLPVNFAALPMDLLSLSAHKFHGPKGIGGLVVKRKTPWQPFLRGGPQERQRRGGTENVAAIVGMGVAAQRALANLVATDYSAAISRLRNQLENGILATIPETCINGDISQRLSNTTNISFKGLEAEAILILLSQQDICASAGAACASGSLEPSHVLRAMRLPDVQAHGAIRFSLSEFTTSAEIESVLHTLPQLIARLREVLPVG